MRLALTDLLAPHPVERFCRASYEQAPLLVERAAPTWLASFPQAADLDGLVRRAAAAKNVWLVKQGAPFPASPDAMGSILGAYRQGATVVVRKAHVEHAGIGALAAALEAELGQPVTVNIYATPPGAQGFKEHADGHDVLVLQLSGQKRWRVYPPVIELALDSQITRPPPLEEQLRPPPVEGYGAPLLETTLAPGHLLYLPRGFVHAAATNAEGSIHLTIGLHGLRQVDLLGELLAEVAERARALRQTVPLLGRDPAAELRALRELVSGFADLARDEEVLRGALSRTARRQARLSSGEPRGSFLGIDQLAALQLNTQLRRRLGVHAVAFPEYGKSALEFSGNRIEGPIDILLDFEFISGVQELSPGELPGPLSDEAKLTLCRRLIAEGLLVQTDAFSAAGSYNWGQ